MKRPASVGGASLEAVTSVDGTADTTAQQQLQLTLNLHPAEPEAVNPSAPKPIAPAAAAATWARWLPRIDTSDPDGCWEWPGARNGDGYGRVWLAGAMRHAMAHRIAWIAATGRDVPAGLVLDHLCRTRACVSPAHLRPVTVRGNTLADGSLSFAADHAARTHCPRGHALAGDNLKPSMLRRGGRDCLTCDRERNRERNRLFMAAARALGLTRAEYRARYGHSRAVAERILEGLRGAA